MAEKNELIVTRVFNAPVNLVWRAWTEPEHFMKWWGPKDFISPICEMDLRVGGKYLFCMRQKSGGRDMFNTGVFKEIIPNEKLVCTQSMSDKDGNIISASQMGMGPEFPDEMIVDVTFEDLDGKTKLTMKQIGMPPSKMRDMAGAGWNQSFDKLEESLK